MKAPRLGKFGAVTFCACHQNDECGANGLPLTPGSIKILGRFQALKTLRHPHLCQYIDIHRSKHERLIIVSEYFTQNLKDRDFTGKDVEQVAVKIAHELLCGLSYLRDNGIVNRSLSPENIVFDEDDRVKVFNYGNYYMTGFGADVSFPVGHMRYLSPEAVVQDLCCPPSVVPAAEDFGLGPDSICPLSAATDVWSLGIILLELLLKLPLWPGRSVQDISSTLLHFIGQDQHPLDLVLSQHPGSRDKFAALSPQIQGLLRHCLTLDPGTRPGPGELLCLDVFAGLESEAGETSESGGFYMFSAGLRCGQLEIPTQEEELPKHMLAERSLQEIYHLWGLAGGDLEFVLRRAGLLRTQPAVCKVAGFVAGTGEVYGEMKDSSLLRDLTVTTLPMEQLIVRLSHIDPVTYLPLMEEEFQLLNSTTSEPLPGESQKSSGPGSQLPASSSSQELAQTSRLPLVIKEKDVEYQLYRMVLFERMLLGYPHLKQRILKEARVDVPPHYRAWTWAAVLDVKGDVQGNYNSLDKESPTVTDRQIEVDIPRCHQYNQMLSSPQGHRKLKRILKAWVQSHPEYVYWQGLDSLCAPFLCLNFNDEALAFACIDNFIPKYLHKFFLKDNSAIIQEYLAVFSHLLAFHDPGLFSHLDGIGFIPDLYAIPWFLTMFAHVFPMHKIYHLWDTLLLGNSSYPLFIGVAILHQFREQLLSFGFNECILHFSDMPEIDIEKCVEDSVRMFCSTPTSATYRQHALNSGRERRNSGYRTTLEMQAIPLHQLKAEKCCRISAEDLLDLKDLSCHDNTATTTYRKSKSGKSKVLVMDIRTRDEYQRGAIPDCVNVPFESAFTADNSLYSSIAEGALTSARMLVKVVVSNREAQAVQFAEKLVGLGFSKVCVLHEGIDVLKTAGVLIVPAPDL